MQSMVAVYAAVQGWCPWCGDHMGWGGGWGMMFGWVLLLAIIILAVWAITRGRWGGGESRGGRPEAGEDRAEAILRERYARGEIDEESYRRRLDELRRG